MGEPSTGEHLPSLPGYRLTRRIGRGGFSVVYEAVQLSLDRLVAVKLLLLDLATPGDARRFEMERMSLSRLGDHRHIVDVVDAGITAEGRAYLVMRLYRGGTLEQVVADRGPMPVADVVRIMAAISDALEYAHGQGVLHRDIAPKNILLTEDGEPALADFGIASIAGPHDGASTTFLTPAHSAPEVLRDERHSVASDVYALASTAYTLLVGRPPYGSGRERAFVPLDRVAPPVDRPDVPTHVRDAVAAGLSPDETARPASAALFARLLRGDDAASTVAAPPLSPSAGLGLPAQVHPAQVHVDVHTDADADVTRLRPRTRPAERATERPALPPAVPPVVPPVGPPVAAPAPPPGVPDPELEITRVRPRTAPRPGSAVRRPRRNRPMPTSMAAPAPPPSSPGDLSEFELTRAPYVAGLLAVPLDDDPQGTAGSGDTAGPRSPKSTADPGSLEAEERAPRRGLLGRRRRP